MTNTQTDSLAEAVERSAYATGKQTGRSDALGDPEARSFADGRAEGYHNAHHGVSYSNRESNPWLDDRHMDGTHIRCNHELAHAYSDGYLAGWTDGLEEWDAYWA